MSRENWKQITFIGYYMNPQNMIDFIKIAKDNGITHILLEFITLGVNNNWSNGLQFADTSSNWINDFNDSDKNSILSELKDANITLGLSMGGASCFNGDFSSTWTNNQSPYYIDGNNIKNIEDSATKLGIDIANIAKNNSLSFIDLDIEHIPTVSSYQNYDDIPNYLGYLSKSIKENINNCILSHSPQSPYFYPNTNGNWKTLYYTIEKDFGDYIDWYNIQYYNQGTYSTESQVFYKDDFYSASVQQLQVANNVQGLIPIPSKKIVVGSGTDSGSGLCKNSSNLSGPSWSTLTTWINNQKNNTNNDWYNNGGIMTWIYSINSDMGYNNELMTFWSSQKINKNLITNYNMTEQENKNTIKYYNGNNLLIDTPQGKEYGGISAWQGIRSLGSDNYLICGTTNPTPNTGNGLIYIGNINCQNGTTYILNVPNSLGTSVYGPDYNISTGKYTFVGSFLDYNQNINGFIYQGKLNDLSHPLRFSYPLINQYFDITFFHSYSNGLFVGNSGNNTKDDATISYIYDINDLNKIKTQIKYPGSSITTTYGIWYNGDNNYTIVGGYSMNLISIDKIYTNNGIIPIGDAFIADYNSESNTFFNWTSINYGDNLLTHFEGISQNENGTYSINADVLDLQVSTLLIGYFLTIDRNVENKFTYNLSNSVKISYEENGVSSSNSVANNKVVGLFIGSDNTKVSYQAEIINDTLITKSNTLMSTVKKDEIIRFDNTFLENNYINYEKGVFTFLEKGTYFVSFNIYIENTTLPSVNLSIEYTNEGKKNSFLIAQKGIDEIGTGTAHSLTLPCSFTNKFSINDTIQIRNTSEGSIQFISNYVENAINGIVSIYKIA